MGRLQVGPNTHIPINLHKGTDPSGQGYAIRSQSSNDLPARSGSSREATQATTKAAAKTRKATDLSPSDAARNDGTSNGAAMAASLPTAAAEPDAVARMPVG